MMMTTTQAFAKFIDDITVTEYQKTSIIEGRKNCAIENLTAAFPSTSDLPFSRAVLMGSAAKGTIARPIDDVDVLAIFSNANGAWSKYQYGSQAFLYRIRKAYDGLNRPGFGALLVMCVRGPGVRLRV